jgi:hypothetical protein
MEPNSGGVDNNDGAGSIRYYRTGEERKIKISEADISTATAVIAQIETHRRAKATQYLFCDEDGDYGELKDNETPYRDAKRAVLVELVTSDQGLDASESITSLSHPHLVTSAPPSQHFSTARIKISTIINQMTVEEYTDKRCAVVSEMIRFSQMIRFQCSCEQMISVG